MNYQKVYDQIIQRSKSRGLDKKKLEGYFEKHHVIPKCMGGLNQNDNYALLTAREHYLAHWLLWKTDKSNYSLMLGYHKMALSKTDMHERDFKISSKQYEILRTSRSLLQVGKIVSDETRKKMSESHKGVPLSKEHTRKIIEGFTSSEKYRDSMKSESRSKKLSDALRGKPNGRKGIPMSEEQKEKLRGREFSDEHKKHLSEAMTGRPSWNTGLKVGPLSDEHKAKISAGSKGRIVSDETRLKLKNIAIERERIKKEKYLQTL